MADEIKVVITGKDGVSRVFQEVAKSADAMQKAIQKDATAAGTSLNKMSQDATKASATTSTAFRNSSREFQLAGAAIGASIALFSRDIVTNQQNIANLTRTYGEAAGQLQAFAQQIQASTTFSSESAIQSANIFGTLVRNYGLNVEQVQQLIQVSADLAATSGLTLEDTSMRVQAAIRGEGEAAEALGLTMNQQAIDRQNLTLTMSNQEAGQFRLNALLEQSAFAEGAAGDKAETTAGKIAQLNNAFQDAARGALAAAGPLPQVISGITSVGAETGFAITGVIALGKGFRDLSSAAGGIKNLITASQGLSAAVGTAGVVGAIGLAAVAAVALSDHMGSYAQSVDKANTASASLTQTIAGLSTTMTDASTALDLTAMLQELDLVDEAVNRIREIRDEMQSETFAQQGMGPDEIAASNARIAALQAEYDARVAIYGQNPESAINQQAAALQALDQITKNTGAGAEQAIADAAKLHAEFVSGQSTFEQYSAGLVDIAGRLDGYQSAALEVQAANQAMASSFIDVTKAITGVVQSDASNQVKQQAVALQDITVEILNSLAAFAGAGDKMWSLTGGADAYIAVQEDVLAILSETGPEAAAAQQALALLETQHASGQISADRFAEEVNVVNANLQHNAAEAALNAAVQSELAASFDLSKFAAHGLAEGVDAAAVSTGRMIPFIDGLGETASRTAADVHDLFAEIEHLTKFPELQLGFGETIERDFNKATGAIKEATVAHEKFDDSVLGAEARLEAYTQQAFDAAKAVGLLSTNAQLFAAAGIKTPALDVAVNLQAGQGSFDAVFGAIKQAQSLASNIGGAKSWADQLIGDPGVWSELDKLLADQRINADQYKAAQEAQISITRDVTNAQEDLNAVQAMQAPALAEATHEQAVYIDSLQDMNETQQRAALGYLDSAESAKAMSLAQLAASSTTDTMKASTTEMIQQAAAADPILKAMLEDMGLLNATTGEVNFDTNAMDIGNEIHELTASIDALITAIGGVPPVHTDSNAPDTQKDVSNLTGEINAVPTSVTTVITAVDNATGTIQEVGRQLRALDGQTARTYLENYTTNSVNNVVTTTNVGGGAIGPTPGRLGGVMGYANGGMVTIEAAEVGGELARFANGGSAYLPSHGLYNVPVGTNILPAPATKAELSRQRGGGDIYINTIQIIAQNGDLEGMLRSEALRLSRQR